MPKDLILYALFGGHFYSIENRGLSITIIVESKTDECI